jgi:hypothetical protein
MNLCINFNPISRTMETGNHLCITSKKFTYASSDKTVSKIIRNQTVLYKVPCILVPYITDLQTFLTQYDINTAIKMTASKYNITIQQENQHIRRYKYSQASPVKTINQLNYFKHVFILYDDATAEANIFMSTYTYNTALFTAHPEDAKYIKVVTNDFITHSNEYSEIIKHYFGSFLGKLPTLVSCNYTTKKNFPQFGLIILDNSKLIYIPFSYNKLHVFYTPFPDNTSVLFNVFSEVLDNILYHLKAFVPFINVCS